MAKIDPELRAHRDWLGLLQPVGLVVSPPALIKAQAVPSQNVAELQQQLVSVVENPPESARGGDDEPAIRELPAFFRTVLGWSADDIAGAPGGPPIPDGIELVLPDYNETLRPTHAVVDSMAGGEPLMLVQALAPGTPLDKTPDDDGRTGWSASPQAKLERLMREVKVTAGLLCNGDALRLIYAPSGESSGHLTFPVAAMCEVSGRPILAALHMLLSEHRVFSAPDGRRLLDILSESRKYQAEVSNALSDQVLGALWELLRGFQASDPEDGRRIFDQTAREEPQHIYGGLLTMLMRLIFVLYAEDEGLMPEGEVYANNYSVSGLYGRLRSDAGRYPDTMDQRYGAYAWLLSLFRLVFDGGGHGGLRLPTRHGQLFNPDEFSFLEGRARGGARVMNEKFEAPRVSDGCIHRVLDALLVLDGERLSYRALDVEQVGSVYEAMMGYEVERAIGRSIAVRPKHIVVSVDELMEEGGAKRNKWLKDQADTELTAASATVLKEAITAEDVVAALGRRVSPRSLDATGTPRLMAPGTLYLQPGEERRRTGSHYTPRELTEPIVRTTLRPVLEALGERPTPEQILELKVCDPAMGSGAFLVETCRQLAERLVIAWQLHEAMPKIPADEEPILHARRLVAQRCLYGVDKNPFAVNLAKLSIWLVTLAKDHAFTFVDHALKNGDSLVGLTKKQIAAFHWETNVSDQADWIDAKLRQGIEEALGWRDALQRLDEGDYTQKKEAWWEAENALADARLIGDLAVAAFFGADKDKAREKLRNQYRSKVEAWRENEVNRHEPEEIVEELRGGEKPVPPMHWEIEFPEVFGRKNPGFDAMVGNPPFLGGKSIAQVLGDAYLSSLKALVNSNKGSLDLAAFFLHQMARLVRNESAFGLIATKALVKGGTREGGLGSLVAGEFHIVSATSPRMWPGSAAVHFVTVVLVKGALEIDRRLDGQPATHINSHLKAHPEYTPPAVLVPCMVWSRGTTFLGEGFVLSKEEKADLLAAAPESAAIIQHLMGGSDILGRADGRPSRFVINFRDMALESARGYEAAFQRLIATVKPQRDRLTRQIHEHCFWKHWDKRKELYNALGALRRAVVFPMVSKHVVYSMADEPGATIFSDQLGVIADGQIGLFAVMQSHVNVVWVLEHSNRRGEGVRMSIRACLGTFPFPENWETDPTLEAAGNTYYKFRADLMVRHDEGLTKTYNRFHDPEEHDPDILRLRELHAAMDRAVLDAYGWDDISTDCEFLLDYEIDEETWGTKKKPYRYRWPEAVHDEVLARLLNLNQKRHEQEVAVGLQAEKGGKRSAPQKTKPKDESASDARLPLFDSMNRPEEA